MKRRGGFPARKFCDQTRSEPYHCLICFEVCRVPVTCQSGAHLFCRDCLTESLRRNLSCPACREPLFAPLSSVFASAQVSALDVVCVHDKCGWRGTCGRLDGHLDTECPHEPIKCAGESGCGALVPRGEMATHQEFFCLQSCPNSVHKGELSEAGVYQDSCDARLSRNELVDHLRNHCKLRLIDCPYLPCEARVPFNQMTDHRQICPYAPVSCPRQCGSENIKRRSLEDHKTKCPEEPVQCAHASFGCSYVAPRGEITQHQEDFKLHFTILSRLYVEQKQQIQQMKRVFEETFQTQAAIFQQKLREQSALFEEKRLPGRIVPPLESTPALERVLDPAAEAAALRAKFKTTNVRTKIGCDATHVGLGLKCYSCGKPATVFFRNNKEPDRNDSYCKNGVSGTCSTYSHMYYGTSQWGRAMSKSEDVDLILRTK